MYHPEQAAVDRRRLLEHCTEVRVRSGVSQRALATRMGTQQSAVSELETGEGGEPRLETLQRYLGALGYELILEVRKC